MALDAVVAAASSDRRATVVLALNSGSSSLKFGLYRVEEGRADALVAGTASLLAGGGSRFEARTAKDDSSVSETDDFADHRGAVERIAALVRESGQPRPDVIGHRVVHGGPSLIDPCWIDDAVMTQLEATRAWAPLHASLALALVGFTAACFRGIAQMACFDTAFHANLPDVARTLPVPRTWRDLGVRRYGFHGLSCEAIVRQLADDVPTRLVIAHLGNGASVTAVKGGASVDNSMGMTPTGGVIMGTRSGDLDPGALSYLMREKGVDAAAIDDVVERHSGLLGISGISNDLRVLHRAASSSPEARLAIAMFSISVGKQIAAMGTVLRGIDLLVFTGGIGEHDAAVRASICDGLSWMGVDLDPQRNEAGIGDLHTSNSRCAVRVVQSQEEQQIALHAERLVMVRGEDPRAAARAE